MFIEQTSGQIVKIKFDINEKQLLLGDIVKIIATGKTGVLAQVVEIYTAEKNPNYNIAESKILFSIEDSGKLTGWQGNIPSHDFAVSRISAEELLLCANTATNRNSISLGTLSLYPKSEVRIDPALFDQPTVIYCDVQSQKDNILSLLALDLSKSYERAALIDFNNDYSDLKVSALLEAGKHIKLPLDVKGLELLYNKTLANVSPETRAYIEDIFIEIENYLSSGEVAFIPFSSFRQALDSVYQSNKLPELVLLKNKLLKLSKSGIFADNSQEINYFSQNINNNNLVIINLSKIPHEWQQDFIEYLIDSNISAYKQKFFLVIDIDKLNANKAFVEKLCTKAHKSGISSVIVAGHDSEISVNLLSYAKNIIAFAPESETKVASLKQQLVRLKNNEALVIGKFTNNVPLFVDIYDDSSLSANYSGSNMSVSQGKLREVYLSTEIEEQPVSRPKAEDFSYSNQFNHDESAIELAQDITNLQEEIPLPQKTAPDEDEYDEDEYSEDLPEEESYDNEEVSAQSSFYDEFESEEDNYADDSEEYESDFSEDDLSEFVDDDDEYASGSSSDQGQGDEDFDYSSNEEFQDESVLDYTSYNQEQSDDFSDSDEDSEEYFSDEEYEKLTSGPASTKKGKPPVADIPVYAATKEQTSDSDDVDFEQGDRVQHPKYGIGSVVKIIGSQDKKLLSIQFEDVGRRLLDPKLAGLQKLN